MFKRFLQAGALDYCQVDACRLGGLNEVLAIMPWRKRWEFLFILKKVVLAYRSILSTSLQLAIL